MPEASIMKALMDVIIDRKNNPPAEPSYVVKLLHDGNAAIGSKIVEEAEEVVEAAEELGAAGRVHLIKETADLVFHTAVMLGFHGIMWSEVEAELAKRFGISGIAEKQSRGTSISDD
jgi:phosphoribosyl-ATP pyrophosphohydrolase